MSAQSAEMDQVPSPGLRDHVFFRLVAVGVCSARQAHREVQSGASIRIVMEMAMDFFPVRMTDSERAGGEQWSEPKKGGSEWYEKGRDTEGKRLAQIYSTRGNSFGNLKEPLDDENEAVTSTTRVMRRGDAMQKRRRGATDDCSSGICPISDGTGQTGRNAHATLILLGMVGPLCIGERWGRRDGLDNTASYPTPAAC